MFSFLATITEVVTGPIGPDHSLYNNRVEKSRNYRIPAFSIIGRLFHIHFFLLSLLFVGFYFFSTALFLMKRGYIEYKKGVILMAGRKKIDISEWLTPENKLRIQGWCRDGLIEKQIYKNMGVSKNTFYRWKNESQEFRNLLKESKDTADREVENALFKSATGFMGPDEKYYPPNTTAQIFWLKNRKHEEWRDKRETDVNIATPVSETALKVEAILKGEE